MDFDIILSAPAEKQLNAAIDYIAEDLGSPIAAEGLLAECERLFLFLKDNSFIVGVDETCSRIVGQPVRKAHVKNYVFFYSVIEAEGAIHLLAFLHGARDFEYALGRRWSR